MIKNELEIKLADISQLDFALSMLKDAGIWLKSKEIDYWQNWISPSDLYINWIKDGFLQNQFYFVNKANQNIGMFRLQWSDELFWGIQENNSGYLHSFRIKRDLHGQCLGYKALQLVENICKQNNKSFFRLDCTAQIERLCAYYENYGFKSVGEIFLMNERLKLYEKSLY